MICLLGVGSGERRRRPSSVIRTITKLQRVLMLGKFFCYRQVQMRFTNKLSKKEINLGVLTIIFKNYLLKIILFALVISILNIFMIKNTSIINSVALFIFLLLVMIVLIYILLRRQFGSQKEAIFAISDDKLYITNYKGIESSFEISNIRMQRKEKVVVLLLDKNTFAIVSVTSLGENRELFLNIFKNSAIGK